LDETKKINDLNKEIFEKRKELDSLEDSNYQLALNVQKHTKCCFRKKVPEPKKRPARPALPPPVVPPPAQSRQEEDRSRPPPRSALAAASSSQSAPIAAPSQTTIIGPIATVGMGAASSSSGSLLPPREGASGSGQAASSSTDPPRLADGGGAASSKLDDNPNPVISTDSFGGGDAPSAAASSTDVPGGQVQGKEKKVMWDVQKRFHVCKEGEEGWIGKQLPASEVMVKEGIPASSLAEAVDFLKANPNYRKEVEYYLVKDEQVWYCIYKRGKHTQDKAQNTLKNYIKVPSQPPADTTVAAGSGAARPGGREKWARPKAAEPTRRQEQATADEQDDSNFV